MSCANSPAKPDLTDTYHVPDSVYVLEPLPSIPPKGSLDTKLAHVYAETYLKANVCYNTVDTLRSYNQKQTKMLFKGE